MNDNFKVTLTYVTSDDSYPEHTSEHTTSEDAFEEADDVAFKNVGLPLELWRKVADFGEGNLLFVHYPNEQDKTSRYKLTIRQSEV